MVLFIIIGLLAGGGWALYGLMSVKQVDNSLNARLNRFDLKPARSLTELELQIPRMERLVRPTQRYLALQVRKLTSVTAVEKMQLKLAQAGHPNNMTVQDFLGLKGLLALAFMVIGAGLLFFVFHVGFFIFLIGAVVFAFAGFMFPELWLRQKTKERQKEIQKFLADAIDVLAISVEAGQGFDGALETLSSRKQNALTYEFDRFRIECQAGKSRREALKDLALRSGVEDLNAFVAAMIQADQLGIGIAQVLKTQADELRVKRRQRAEIKAHQAPIKMLFPLIFLMFPSLFIVILGPAIPTLMGAGNM
jgi:tight adherence protein C